MNSSLRIARTATELKSFLQDTIDRSNFKLSRVKLSEQQEWNLVHGVLGHKTGGFFYITGLIDNISDREQLVLYQPQSAFNGLVVHKQENNVYVLLQARIEPGNSGIGQYGPTIQSTPANYLRFHGGKETPYFDFFFKYNPQVRPIANSTQLDLGKRYFQKSKVLSYVESISLVETAENMIWVPLEIISQVFNYDNFFNTDLRSMIGVFDWDIYLSQTPELTSCTKVSFNDYPCLNNLSSKNMGKLVPISELQNWELTDEGVIDKGNSGVSVNIYKVACTNREVRTWIQPLLCAANRGLITLLMRQVNNKSEFLLSYQSEFGISGEKVLLPSYIIYPGENHQNKTTFYQEGKVLSEVIQSEEGGRFYLNENIYQVILVAPDFEGDNSQFWVDADALKGLLKTSNLVSIQLRCITSLILKIMNPNTLGDTAVQSKILTY